MRPFTAGFAAALLAACGPPCEAEFRVLNVGVLRPDMEAQLSVRNCTASTLEYPRSQVTSIDGGTIAVHQVTRNAWLRLEPWATGYQQVLVPRGVVSGWYRFSIEYAPVDGVPKSATSNTVLIEP